MRKTIFILLLTLAFGISLQARPDQKVIVQINHQETVPQSNLKIKFVALVEDSRCPTDTKCIQAGNAKIQIEVRRTGGTWKIFELNTNDKPQFVSFAGYTINLVDLNPKPASNIRINRFGYKAIFNVRKIDNK